ncbi:error-prone DNA polymerase [Lacimicrobium alkaliphilum]|uniref:Error-prone DNA polymerase n=1 Tax=Lacimicrobium alkaliphilum TaxID=1526571 RepID=A0ABQ1RQ53_9ALTE|nr:error-prone DNA polymerase [Lacimicrobium alkaliphilum]GGD77457.1 error-prone DNA polymerase [Lacimicrobium alkaliphilum]
MAYAELFCQSNFTFLTGASHPQELVRQADFLGYEALAITDECSLAGVVRAYTEIKERQLSVKLIVGSLMRLEPDLQVILLCPDKAAYSELCRIITNARRRARKGHYQLHEWDLKSVRHCLIIWLPNELQSRNEQWSKWLLTQHSERLWIGCRRLLKADEQNHFDYCQQLSQTLDIPITCCSGVLMHHSERLPLQHCLTAIRLKTTVAGLGHRALSNSEASLRPLHKLNRLYPDEWIEQSLQIARRCTFSLDELRYQYPAELVPDSYSASDYLKELTYQGAAERYPDGVPDKVNALLEKELALIALKQYEYFFLTIRDIVGFAKTQQILYQGRGSAANSAVCYCLHITAVDPSKSEVLFERFISKERNEPPDIDVDFEHERREEVIQYIYKKYGRERTALAATVITYRLKSAIRDIGKALGIEETQLDFFIKNINRRDSGLNWQFQLSQLGLDPDALLARKLIQLVEDVLGFPRHLSQHVGGFVISSGPLYELVPVENASMEERTVIQWDKDDLESMKLIKVDILALGMLTAIRKCFDLVEKHYGRKLSIAQISNLNDDAGVYKMIQRADTVGVFQIESRAQMSMLPRLKPHCYYDLVIEIAIVRPGPIQGDMVHPYLRRRDGKEQTDYPSDAVKKVLDRTLGVPIFQEQVIQLAMVAAGFSGGEADQLRRAMGSWKRTGELKSFEQKLIQGMLDRGYKRQFAERLYQQICGFGEYGFPESHSASFAVLAYVSAWLKHHYPAAFYTALLNSWPMGFYSPSQLIQDARRRHISVLPVCINHSDYDYTLQADDKELAIRIGLRQVKGLSTKSARAIVGHRPKQGFEGTSELRAVVKKDEDLQALASADALKALSGGCESNRYQARWMLMDNTPTLPLFSQIEEPDSQWSASPSGIDNMLEDYSSTGMTLNTHPIDFLRKEGLLDNTSSANELSDKPHNTVVRVAGLVQGRQSPGTASGVTFITLEDDTGNINVIVWRATARAQKQAYLKSSILKVTGVIEKGDGGVIHIIAGKLEDLSHQLQQLKIKSRDFH